MRCLRIAGVVLVAIAVAAGIYVVSGSYDVAADKPHWAVTFKFLEFARDRSIESHASSVRVPADLDNPTRIKRGRELYGDMCAGCHLIPGVQDTEISKGLYPTPPRLASKPVEDPRVAFWTIKHGVKMTGMPAWGKTHDDELIWDMVAFLHKLPQLSPEQYRNPANFATPEKQRK